MLARVYSCAVIGLEGVVVEVEVDTADGLPVGSRLLGCRMPRCKKAASVSRRR